MYATKNADPTGRQPWRYRSHRQSGLSCKEKIHQGFHFVRERLVLGSPDVSFVSSSEQVAEVFTKPATRHAPNRLCRNLNLVNRGAY